MGRSDPTDDELLAGRDAASFEALYLRYAETLLAYFVRRTRDPELAADLTAETWAAALAGRRRFDPRRGAAAGWLFGIAAKKLADAQRRGFADRAARRRLGMERLALDDADILRIEALGEAAAGALVELLPSDQRRAVRAHVVDELPYGALAAELDTSEAVVRKRVSRGLAAVRDKLGPRP
jgi:RNA polymerase sigma-70 factor, ECF subfamily